jgi:hypothetical protein
MQDEDVVSCDNKIVFASIDLDAVKALLTLDGVKNLSGSTIRAQEQIAVSNILHQDFTPIVP